MASEGPQTGVVNSESEGHSLQDINLPKGENARIDEKQFYQLKSEGGLQYGLDGKAPKGETSATNTEEVESEEATAQTAEGDEYGKGVERTQNSRARVTENRTATPEAKDQSGNFAERLAEIDEEMTEAVFSKDRNKLAELKAEKEGIFKNVQDIIRQIQKLRSGAKEVSSLDLSYEYIQRDSKEEEARLRLQLKGISGEKIQEFWEQMPAEEDKKLRIKDKLAEKAKETEEAKKAEVKSLPNENPDIEELRNYLETERRTLANILERIKNPKKTESLSAEQLAQLAEELRRYAAGLEAQIQKLAAVKAPAEKAKKNELKDKDGKIITEDGIPDRTKGGDKGTPISEIPGMDGDEDTEEFEIPENLKNDPEVQRLLKRIEIVEDRRQRVVDQLGTVGLTDEKAVVLTTKRDAFQKIIDTLWEDLKALVDDKTKAAESKEGTPKIDEVLDETDEEWEKISKDEAFELLKNDPEVAELLAEIKSTRRDYDNIVGRIKSPNKVETLGRAELERREKALRENLEVLQNALWKLLDEKFAKLPEDQKRKKKVEKKEETEEAKEKIRKNTAGGDALEKTQTEEIKQRVPVTFREMLNHPIEGWQKCSTTEKVLYAGMAVSLAGGLVSAPAMMVAGRGMLIGSRFATAWNTPNNPDDSKAVRIAKTSGRVLWGVTVGFLIGKGLSWVGEKIGDSVVSHAFDYFNPDAAQRAAEIAHNNIRLDGMLEQGLAMKGQIAAESATNAAAVAAAEAREHATDAFAKRIEVNRAFHAGAAQQGAIDADALAREGRNGFVRGAVQNKTQEIINSGGFRVDHEYTAQELADAKLHSLDQGLQKGYLEGVDDQKMLDARHAAEAAAEAAKVAHDQSEQSYLYGKTDQLLKDAGVQKDVATQTYQRAYFNGADDQKMFDAHRAAEIAKSTKTELYQANTRGFAEGAQAMQERAAQETAVANQNELRVRTDELLKHAREAKKAVGDSLVKGAHAQAVYTGHEALMGAARQNIQGLHDKFVENQGFGTQGPVVTDEGTGTQPLPPGRGSAMDDLSKEEAVAKGARKAAKKIVEQGQSVASETGRDTNHLARAWQRLSESHANDSNAPVDPDKLAEQRKYFGDILDKHNVRPHREMDQMFTDYEKKIGAGEATTTPATPETSGLRGRTRDLLLHLVERNDPVKFGEHIFKNPEDFNNFTKSMAESGKFSTEKLLEMGKRPVSYFIDHANKIDAAIQDGSIRPSSVRSDFSRALGAYLKTLVAKSPEIANMTLNAARRY